MKTYKIETIEIQEVETVMCNCCGKILLNEKDDHLQQSINVKVNFGYFANIFDDGERHEVDVCEECYANWIKTFKHAPTGFGKPWDRDFEMWALSK